MAAALALGLVIGSFLNVVIARVPHGKSVWQPRSACPGCAAPIAWRDNIPLLSFVALRGRCRHCGMAIGWRYPLIEAGTAAAFTVAYLVLGPTLDFAVAAALLAALIAITGIDLAHQIIPDVISLPGIAAGFAVNLGLGRIAAADRLCSSGPAAAVAACAPAWLDSLIGIAVGGGIFFVIIVASRGGMGGGDMKLGAMLGAFLGWKLGLLGVLLGVLGGGAAAICLLLLRRKGRKEAIPFGPFLALGGAIALLWGDKILDWYFGRFAP
ncbi:MAG TPA: prepilin peptidase [Candidatus Methylomirabilis sp.]|nr:prepilin peptidase [Candidatus Methylomirabilis sp.]